MGPRTPGQKGEKGIMGQPGANQSHYFIILIIYPPICKHIYFLKGHPGPPGNFAGSSAPEETEVIQGPAGIFGKN
jgi:hypothetical protein